MGGVGREEGRSKTFEILPTLCTKDSYVNFFRYIFAFIYTSEMFLKIIARGFVLNSYTYLRNPWNWLDFTVVIMGYVLFFISTKQYSLMF